MAFIPAPNVIKVEWIYSLENSVCENTFYYELGAPADISFMLSFADMIRDVWINGFRNSLSAALTLTKIKVTAQDEQSSPGVEFTDGLPVAGLSVGECLPANCAAQLTFYTGLRGRSYRGRMFVPGIPESSCSGSTLGSTFRDNLALAAFDMESVSLFAVNYNQVVVSRQYNNQPRAVAAVTPVTTQGVGPYVVSQRRRLPGRGM